MNKVFLHTHQYLLTFITFGLLFLTGCAQINNQYTLNPDGSGKVKFKVDTSAGTAMGMNNNQSPDQVMRSTVQNTLFSSKGIKTWKDLQFKMTDEGRVLIEGIAYFDHINQVQLFNTQGTESGFEWSGDTPTRTLKMKMTSRDNPSQAQPLTDEQVEQKIKLIRMQMNQSKPMLSMVFGQLKVENTFKLPGTVTQAHGFKAKDQSAEIALDGEKIMGVFEAMVKDEKYLKESLQQGKNPMQDGDPSYLFQKLYGKESPPEVKLKEPFKIVFDYKAESDSALKAFPEMLKKLKLSERPFNPFDQGSEETSAEPPAKGEPFKSIKVTGLRLRKAREYGDPSLELTLTGQLAGSIEKIAKGSLDAATGDDGSNLLPSSRYEKEISWGDLNSNKTEVSFDVKLNSNTKATKVKLLKGTFAYKISRGTSEIDLGTIEFKQGAVGKLLGAHIKHLNRNGDNTVGLELSLRNESIKDIQFFDSENGQPIKADSYGSSSSNKKTTRTYRFPNGLPSEAKVVLIKFKRMQTYKIPFELKDIPLSSEILFME